MFEELSQLALQQYWWCIVSLLGALLVFLMFVQGGQTLIYTLGKNDLEQKMLVNALGRKWEYTFTTLVTFGGAFFASFPLFYASSFGGAYWVWYAILFSFVIQAVSYEYRSKPNNFFGKKGFDAMLFINGLLGTILIGTAVATFFTGSAFSIDEVTRQVQWEGNVLGFPTYGLEAILNPINPILGLAIFFLARVLGLLFFIKSVAGETIYERAKKQLWINAILFLVFFLTFLVCLLLIDGFAVNPTTKEVFMQPNKYFWNLIEMPINTLIFLAGVVLVLWGIIATLFTKTKNGIWFAGLGTVLTVFATFLLAGFNNTAFYPSNFGDLQSSLTIENASSSHFTLTAMSYVSLMVPFVLAYIWYAWKALTSQPITAEEMENDSHAY
ncbi:MAG: cytochrome d ubiquinol oxidase subunit II [Flavobacteriaceae bacterium]|nr:cytochrome d ubiquinol oxidase subunit II [Flavobacteriaceae bacterium]